MMSLTHPSTALKIDKAYRLIGRNPKTVVFVTPLLRPREIKMATALKSVGWQVVLLYKRTTPFNPSDVFDVAIRLPDDDALHRVARILEPRICHVFSGAVDDALLQFCRIKPSPIVVDLNDMFCPSLFNYHQERFEPTRECLSLADALCCRDLQPKFAKRYDDFRLPPKILMFPEYPWIDGPALDGAVAKGDQDEVHVVSVGTFTLETQGMHDSAYLRLARMLAEQKIHLHIYPHWFYRDTPGSAFRFNQKADFADFLKLEEETAYFHLHDSLPVDELARVLPQYDFGIISGGCEALGQKLDFLTERYMRACYSGRIADYLDARLPIIINPEVAYNNWLLKHYGVAVDLHGLLAPGFRETLLALKQSPDQAERVEGAVKRLDLLKHAERLSKFYEDLIESRPLASLRVPIWMRASTRIPVVGSRLKTVISLALETTPLRQRLSELERQSALLKISGDEASEEFEERAHQLRVRHEETVRQFATKHAETIWKSEEEIRQLEREVRRIGEERDDARRSLAAREQELQIAQQRIAAMQAESAQTIAHELRRQRSDLERLALEHDTVLAELRRHQEEDARLDLLASRIDQKLHDVGSVHVGEIKRLSGEIERVTQGRISAIAALSERDEALREATIQAHTYTVDSTNEREEEIRHHSEQIQRITLERDAAIVELRRARGSEDVLKAVTAKIEKQHHELLDQLKVVTLPSLRGSELQRSHDRVMRENEELRSRLAALRQEAQIGDLQVDHIAGLLNWPELSADAQRSQGFHELVRILGLFLAREASEDVDAGSSKAWDLLNRKNLDQLVSDGYNRFKRTIALNYFTFPVQQGDPQIDGLVAIVGADEAARLYDVASSLPDDPDFALQPQRYFRYLMLLLWQHANSIDSAELLSKVDEPAEGGPVALTVDGRFISQDLANSTIEYYSMAEGVDFSRVDRILEIGGGYGRVDFLIGRAHPDVKLFLIDIPPAIYLAQRYLCSVLNDRTSFRVREFSRFEDVRSEIEQASLIFLLPHQLKLIPDNYFDLSINISSFGEMTKAQIEEYFSQIDRTTRGFFYHKQWQTSQNPFDELVLKQEDYPARPHWREVYARACSTNSSFFEALYATGRTHE